MRQRIGLRRCKIGRSRKSLTARPGHEIVSLVQLQIRGLLILIKRVSLRALKIDALALAPQ
jgi:hypothetical protein